MPARDASFRVSGVERPPDLLAHRPQPRHARDRRGDPRRARRGVGAGALPRQQARDDDRPAQGPRHHRADLGVHHALQLLRAAGHQHPAGRRDPGRHDHPGRQGVLAQRCARAAHRWTAASSRPPRSPPGAWRTRSAAASPRWRPRSTTRPSSAGMELVAHTPAPVLDLALPEGREATVSYGGPGADLRQRLGRRGADVGRARARTASRCASSPRPLGRKVTPRPAPRTNVVEPTEHETVNPDLEPGRARGQAGDGRARASPSATREVVTVGDEVKRDETFTWTYDAQDAFIEVGPKKDEARPAAPRDGTTTAPDEPTTTAPEPSTPPGARAGARTTSRRPRPPGAPPRPRRASRAAPSSRRPAGAPGRDAPPGTVAWTCTCRPAAEWWDRAGRRCRGPGASGG